MAVGRACLDQGRTTLVSRHDEFGEDRRQRAHADFRPRRLGAFGGLRAALVASRVGEYLAYVRVPLGSPRPSTAGKGEPFEPLFVASCVLSRGKCEALCASPGPVARDLTGRFFKRL